MMRGVSAIAQIELIRFSCLFPLHWEFQSQLLRVDVQTLSGRSFDDTSVNRQNDHSVNMNNCLSFRYIQYDIQMVFMGHD